MDKFGQLINAIGIIFSGAESKKPAVRRVFLNGSWQCPTLTWGSPTLPSALIRFTSEFGMESGGTVSLWLPGKTGNNLETGYQFNRE